MTGGAHQRWTLSRRVVKMILKIGWGVRGEGYLTGFLRGRPRRISELPVLKWLQKWSQKWFPIGSSFWDCFGTAPGLLWDCLGAALGLLWGSSGTAFGLLWGCSGAHFAAWYSSGSGTAPGLLLKALGRPWGCSGTALGQLWLLAVLWECPGAALGLRLARLQVRPFLRALCGCSGAALKLL